MERRLNIINEAIRNMGSAIYPQVTFNKSSFKLNKPGMKLLGINEDYSGHIKLAIDEENKVVCIATTDEKMSGSAKVTKTGLTVYYKDAQAIADIYGKTLHISDEGFFYGKDEFFICLTEEQLKENETQNSEEVTKESVEDESVDEKPDSSYIEEINLNS